MSATTTSCKAPPSNAVPLGALLLAVAVALGGCGGSSGSGQGATPVAGSPVDDAPAPAPSPSPSPSPSPTPAPPVVVVPPPAGGSGTLATAPGVRYVRDDRVVTLEMDFKATEQFGQFWTMSGSPDDDAGFLVVWWPTTTTLAERTALATSLDANVCISPGAGASRSGMKTTLAEGSTRKRPRALENLPAGARWLVTGNRRVQLQPVDNDRAYRVRVQRLSARGQITSQATEFDMSGGDGSRVAALRASLTHFDDFNLPAGPADERLWNNASMVSTDPRFNLFFVNDQLHAHTLHGTRLENTGDRSQTSQRFRKRMRIESGTARRIVFDMDSPMSPRSVWYLDLNPVPTDVSGHASFFDEEGAQGLPAHVLRLRASGQSLSVNLIGGDGAAHRVAEVNLEEANLQMVPNVRRHFELRVDTGSVRIWVDGKQVIDGSFAPLSLPAGDYEALWVDFGYNSTKDGVPYFLHHWDNFGFDGPVIDANVVHNYVTRVAGTDYQKASAGQPATFTVRIPDDLRPTTAGATAEAWLVWTYQMGDYSSLDLGAGDSVQVNGGTSYTLPRPSNNTQPPIAEADLWGVPRTARIKLGDITRNGTEPLRTGDNTLRFNARNAGLLNVHVEVHYPAGSAPAYTPPAGVHAFPMPSGIPKVGPPVRITRVGATGIGGDMLLHSANRQRVEASGTVAINIEAGNGSWDAGWAPQWMHSPVQSLEVWSTGGTAGLSVLEVFLRPAGSGSGPGTLVMTMDTAIDAPAPQGRYLLNFDTRGFPNGDYELFVRAVTSSGGYSHPGYAEVLHMFPNFAELAGAYYPIGLRIRN